jgi:uncharacterized damage-inducible protein DinB
MILMDFIKVLELNKNLLTQLIESMTETEINNKIKDYWTIYEHLVHLVQSQKVFTDRIKIFENDDNPIMIPSGPEKDGSKNATEKQKNIKELLKEFCELRNEQIEYIKVSGEKILNKNGLHKEYKKYSFEILIRHYILHDYFHMCRMEELWIKKEEYILDLNCI